MNSRSSRPICSTIADAFRPTTSENSTSGGFPIDLSTEEACEAVPASKLISSFTFPSIAETEHVSVWAKRFNALYAFIAQSGQSIPRKGHEIW